MFRIHRVNRENQQALEQLGSKSKFWFHDNDRRMLFKAEERGTGEDWAEKVACHLCKLLGLPHVHYELAKLYEGDRYLQPGVICETCSPAPLSLVLGNQLLLEHDPNYPVFGRQKFKVRAHTVQAVAEVILDLSPPSADWMASIPAGIETALDVFVGYMMLDAWIANQDRHHENWAAIRDDELRLAPTFDHGASLARLLTDEERSRRLKTRDQNFTVEFFARRASSAFYNQSTDSDPLGTVEAFVAFARLAPAAARIWLDRMAGIPAESVHSILDEVPNERMSNITKEFTRKLLRINQERLLQEKVV